MMFFVGCAGFGPCFHLTGFHFGTGFLSDSNIISWWLPAIRFLSFLFSSLVFLVVGFLFSPLKVKLVAGDLRTAQIIWLWLSKPTGSHFGVFGAPPILGAYFSGDWDVHWGYG